MNHTISTKKLFWYPFFLVLFDFSINLSNDMFMPAILNVQAYFACTAQQIQSASTYFQLGSCLLVLFLSPMAEYWGRRSALLGSCFLFTLGTFICTYAHSIDTFLIGRFLEGASSASLLTVGYATIQDLYKGTHAVKVLSKMSACLIMGRAFSPILGSYLLTIASWQLIFQVILGFSIISFITLYISMPESVFDRAPKLEFKKAFTEYLGILKSPIFIAGNLCNSVTMGGIICWTMTAPMIIMKEFGVAAKFFPFLQLPILGAYSFGSLITDRLATNWSSINIIRLGVWVCLVSTCLLSLKTFFPCLGLVDILVGTSLFSLGSGIINPILPRFTFLAIPYSMSCKSGLFAFNMALVGVIFSYITSRVYKGDCAAIAYMLLSFSALLYVLKKILIHTSKDAQLSNT